MKLLREFNDCHAPDTGRFCATDGDSRTDIKVTRSDYMGRVDVKLGSGYGHVSLLPMKDGYLYVETSHIEKELRGKGHGQRMFLAAAGWAKAHGYKGIRSDRTRSKAASRMWDRLASKTGRVRRETLTRVLKMRGGDETHSTDYDVLERELLEFNDCHSPEDGKFCSTPGGGRPLKITHENDRGRITFRLGDRGEFTLTKGKEYLAVETITLDTELRGKGWGQKMYLAAADWAKSHGYKGILSVADARSAAASRAWDALRRKTGRVHRVAHNVDALERALLEFNPYHEPAGTSKGGQFARKGAGQKTWVGVAKDAMIAGTNRWEQQYGSLFKAVEARVQQVLSTEGDTKSRHTRPDGTYTAARLAFHAEIAQRYLAKQPKVPASERPLAILTGGLPGSGKTTGVMGDIDRSNKVYINSDDIKDLMPGYEGWNAAVYHRESEDISQLVLDIARERKQHLIFDYTMKSGESALMRVRDLQRAGYRVEGRFVDVPVERSVDGALGRFVRGLQKGKGRYVHPAYIRGHEVVQGTHRTTRSRRAFDKIKGRLAAFKVVSTDVERGSPPILLEQRGKLTS